MTVIHLGGVGFPRDEETVTTPQQLISDKNWRERSHPYWALTQSETTRAAYDQWKKEHGLAGITIGNTTISNAQIVVILAGAAVGYYVSKKYLSKSTQGAYVTALAGAIIAYFVGR